MASTVKAQRTAIVVGASIAGLCAARVLAKYYDKVTILESDPLSETVLAGRKGVPQSRFPHALLKGGELALEQLLPGFGAELMAGGALRLDMGLTFAFCRPGGWTQRIRSGLDLYWCSRSLTENTVRKVFRRTVANVEMLSGARVVELCTEARSAHVQVSGVIVRRDEGSRERHAAQLVVDATGRSSQALRWLEPCGMPPIATETVDAHVTYAGRWYRAPEPARRPRAWWWNGLWIDPIPGSDPYFGLLAPAEHDMLYAGVSWYGQEGAPRDEASFTQAMRRVRTPLMTEAPALATPLSDVMLTRSTANRWHHYERASRPLGGLIAIGDAVCSLNPTYGQGMTVAAQSAVLLDRLLSKSGANDPTLGTRFFVEQAKLIELPWVVSTGADLQFETTEGKRSRLAGAVGLYLGALFECAYVTPSVLHRVLRVMHLIAPIESLFEPTLMRDVAQFTLLRHVRPASVRSLSSTIPAASTV
jgi:2-polyprenyl-6-methoxyphenol hydroxylase-like FAD-dependent oxidoreductase